MSSAATFKEFITLSKTGDGTFESRYPPAGMGSGGNNAYGGCAIATAMNAAFQTLPDKPTYYPYSMTGYYLGPAATSMKLTFIVRHIRDTRTFATRTVEVSQEMGGTKGKRMVLFATVDFQVAEPPMMVYSAPPTKKYGGLDKQLPTLQQYETLVHAGYVSREEFENWKNTFELALRFFEQKPCKEGIFAQNMMGLAKQVKTTQDDLPITQKTSADWLRVRHPVSTHIEQACAVNFIMDASIAFMPLSHDHKYFDDAAAVSSLDFALRIFSNNIDINKWHLREMTSANGAEARTYSEARLWDSEGNMVCSMTQQSIMRPKKAAKM